MGVQYFRMVLEYNGVIYYENIGTIPDNSELQSYVIPGDDKIIRINIYSADILEGLTIFTENNLPPLTIATQTGDLTTLDFSDSAVYGFKGGINNDLDIPCITMFSLYYTAQCRYN